MMTMNGQQRKDTILVVDDTPDNIALLSSLLKDQYRTKVATGGEAALKIAGSADPPDLVLLDIMMPEMDGYEVCRRLKENERLKDVPVIFLSALNETMDKVKAFGMGGVDYVTKPFQCEEVQARVATHLKLRRLQMELEKQNRQLQENYEQLNRLNAQKDEFLRIASHDLKNPLTCILGYAALVEEIVKPGTAMTPEMYNCVERITRQCRVMQKIIVDFLDFQAMEDGQFKLTPKPADLNELVRAAVENNAGYAAGKTISVSLSLEPELPRITVDGSRISQIAENLVNNAIKFSPKGRQVAIHTRSGEGFVLVEVRDTGPGLTDADLQKLFVKYAKLSNKPTGGEKSSGLGLAICKKLIDLHRGQIGARNNSEGGATFWFQLPRDA